MVAVASLGKIAAGAAATAKSGDRVLIGLGMLWRGRLA